MSVINILKAIKQIHKNEIIMIKIGDFYHVYGKDSYILGYLMKYKLKTIKEQKEEYCTCGFPTKVLPKIEAILEEKKINYILLDRRNNYEEDEFIDFKNLNKYESIFENAYRYIKQKEKLDKIYTYFLNNIQKDETKKLLNEIEKRILC